MIGSQAYSTYEGLYFSNANIVLVYKALSLTSILSDISCLVRLEFSPRRGLVGLTKLVLTDSGIS